MCKLAFLGDVYLKNEKNHLNISEPYIFNYECVAATSSAKPMINKINLKGNPNFDGFTTLPIAVNLANNHILDFLDMGVENTLQVLENNQIKYFGVGTKENNYNNPCMINFQGTQIAFLGYNDIHHPLKQSHTLYKTAIPYRKQVEQDILLCRQRGAERIIINVHWGREERFWNTKHQQELGRLFVDLGANLVIGHHSHCIQPVDFYKGHYIFYSLGNAYFPDIATPAYYNENGKSEFVMHKKHFRYGRKSLKVTYDVKKDEVLSIQLLELKKNKLHCNGKIAYQNVVPPIYQYPFINAVTGYYHMLTLFIKSYLCTDGKFFSIKALKKELEFINKKRSLRK